MKICLVDDILKNKQFSFMKTYHYQTNDTMHHIVCCNFRDSAKTINLIGRNV